MVSISFALVCITAPLCGVLFGGKLVDSYGGYTSKEAIKIFTTTPFSNRIIPPRI